MNFLKKVFGNIQTLLIVVLVIVILMKSCGEETTDPQIITKTKTEYISVEKKVLQYVPKWKTGIKNKINISAQYKKPNDSIGYVVLDVDKSISKNALDLLRNVKHTIKVRMLY